jgi:WD40 repeat protein
MVELNEERDEQISRLLDQALAEYRANGHIDLAAWQARLPECGAELPSLLYTLQQLEGAMSGDCGEQDTAVPRSASGEPTSAPAGATPFAPLAVPVRLGRYHVRECLGAGGMGAVYRAEDPQLHRTVAIKVPHFTGPEEARSAAHKRFLREARSAAAVRHPHVCAVHDAGEDGGVPYVVMEYVEGSSLEKRLAGEGQLDCREAVRMARQAAEGLAAVHSKGIIHRDLKPANILLNGGGRVLLSDFGLARPELDAEGLTSQGALVGTAAYMPPEQVDPACGAVGPWSDVYSLGVVLYRMLTGRVPFQGDGFRVLRQHVDSPPPAPSGLRADLDPALEAIVVKALAKKPADRYASADALRAALDDWLAGPTNTIPPAAAGHREKAVAAAGAAMRRGRRRLWIAGGLVAAAALAALAVVYVVTDYGTLVVKTEDPDAVVEVTGRQVVVLHGKDRYELRLRPGALQVDVRGGKGRLKISRDRVVLTRGARELVSITVEKSTPEIKKGKPPTEVARPRFPGMPKETVVVVGDLRWRWSGAHWPSEPPHFVVGPGGKRVLALQRGPDDVRAWDPSKPDDLSIHHVPGLQAAAFTADGKLAATLTTTLTGESEWEWKVWEVAGWKEVAALPGDGPVHTRLALAPGGKLAASAAPGRESVLWDVANRKKLTTIPFPAQEPALAFSADGKLLVVAGVEGTGAMRRLAVRLVDVEAGKEKDVLRASVALPENNLQLTRISFSGNGQTLACEFKVEGAVSFWSGHVQLWDLGTGKEGPRLEGNAYALAPDGKSVALGKDRDRILIVETATRKELHILSIRSNPDWGPRVVRSLAFAPDGRTLVSATTDTGAIRLWDVGKEEVLAGPSDGFHYHALSADGKMLAGTPLNARELQLRDLATNKVRKAFYQPKGRVFRDAAFALDGHKLAVIDQGGTTNEWLYNLETGDRVDVDHVDQGGFFAADLALAGGTLVLIEHTGTRAGLWDARTGKRRTLLKRGKEQFSAFALTSDGKMLATGLGGDLVLWDVGAGDEAARLKDADGKAWKPRELAFNKAGTRLAALYQSLDLIVWDVAARKPLFRRKLKPPFRSTGFALAPDGKTVFLALEDGRLLGCTSAGEPRVWRFPAGLSRVALSADGKHLVVNCGPSAAVLELGQGGKP